MDQAIVGALDKEIGAFLQEEYDAKGSEGLYQWYRHRFVPNKIGLAPYDREIVKFVLANRDLFDRHVEIGAAAAQECLLLAVHPMPAYAVESNFDNIDLLRRLIERLGARLDAEISRYITQIDDWYPLKATEYVTPNSVLCFPTLSSTQTEQEEQKAIDAMRSAAGVIFGVRDFFRPRYTDEEHEALIARVRAAGFDPPIEVYEWKEPELGFPPNRIVYMARSGGPATAARSPV